MRAASFALAAVFLTIATSAAAEDPPKAGSSPRASAPSGADMWETARLPWYAPATLTYEEGMPLPPGYTLVRRRPRALLAAGAALFAGSYLTSALVAGTVIGGHARHRSEVAPLFAPLAGPWITLATARDAALNDPDRRANGVLLVVDGLAQLTGAALLVAGLVMREPVLVRTKESYGTEKTSSWVPEVVIGPRAGALVFRF